MRKLARSLLSSQPAIAGWLRRILARVGMRKPVSSGYQVLVDGSIQSESRRLRGAWQSQRLPVRQRRLVDRQLAEYRTGRRVDVFDLLVDALRMLPIAERSYSMLEVGCSSGYYSEVLGIAGLDMRYSGCDYSRPFIDFARATYPSVSFSVEDATALSYRTGEFDIVVSGCCLLHIPEYSMAIAETARVAKQFAIFHRTPIIVGGTTTFFRKRAYGVETIEIHFGSREFEQLLLDNGLSVIGRLTLDGGLLSEDGPATATYVCKKQYQQ